MKQKKLILIAGPTAVGKTDLAIRMALHFRTEILSADSRQFYREMTIGTAKPTEKELVLVKHHFINNLSIDQDYSVGDYETQALALLSELFQKYDTVVLTGGSGLFIKVVCDGLDDIPEVNPEIRKALNKEFNENGLEFLLEELKEKDPDYYGIVDKSNPVRVIRALELCRGTGNPFSLYRTSEKKKRPFKVIKIGLNRDREELYQRIDQRMDKMIEVGLIEEVKNLYLHKERNALQTVGYTEVFDFLDGKYGQEEMLRLLKRNSRRYAKRQLTWFSKDKEFSWFHPSDERKIMEFIEKNFIN